MAVPDPRHEARSASRLAALLVSATLAATTLGACGGGDVPDDGVAKVGETVIERAEFDRRLQATASGQPGGAALDPPEFTGCVGAKRQQGARGDEEELERQCEQEYNKVKGSVMRFLIQAEWVRQEAAAEGIEVTEEEVDGAFEQQVKDAFPDGEGYEQFIASTSEEDLRARIELELLREKLSEKVGSQSEADVDNAQVTEYHEKHKDKLAQPERRDLRVIRTTERADAQEAKEALESGEGFAAVAERVSVDEASKQEGGKLVVVEGQEPRALNRAVFKATQGELQGPVETSFGYYVFRVDRVVAGREFDAEQATAAIENRLRAQHRKKVLQDFMSGFKARYRERTTCAEGFEVSLCANGPEDADPVPGAGG
jgi:foldase protein PrsA